MQHLELCTIILKICYSSSLLHCCKYQAPVVRDLLAKKQGSTEAMEVIAAVGYIRVLKESF